MILPTMYTALRPYLKVELRRDDTIIWEIETNKILK